MSRPSPFGPSAQPELGTQLQRIVRAARWSEPALRHLTTPWRPHQQCVSVTSSPQLPCGREGFVDAERKAKLGTRWSCTECNSAFYDLGKTEALCPRCGTKQVADLPAKKKRATKRSAGNYRRPLRQPAEPKLPAEDDAFTELLEDDNGPVEEEQDS